MIKILKFLFLCLAISTLFNGGPVMADEKDMIHLTLKDGVVKIETRPDLAPKHVMKMVKKLLKKLQMVSNKKNLPKKLLINFVSTLIKNL